MQLQMDMQHQKKRSCCRQVDFVLCCIQEMAQVADFIVYLQLFSPSDEDLLPKA